MGRRPLTFPSSGTPATPLGPGHSGEWLIHGAHIASCTGEQLHQNLQTAFSIHSRSPPPILFSPGQSRSQGRRRASLPPCPSGGQCGARGTRGYRGSPLHMSQTHRGVSDECSDGGRRRLRGAEQAGKTEQRKQRPGDLGASGEEDPEKSHLR